MKLTILALFVSLNVFAASVTPQQMRDIRAEAKVVMMDLGANPELSPMVTSVRIIEEIGSRVKVKFTYVEEMYGSKTCTFYYDLVRGEGVPRTALCGL